MLIKKIYLNDCQKTLLNSLLFWWYKPAKMHYSCLRDFMETLYGVCFYQHIRSAIWIYHAGVINIPFAISLSSKRRPIACTGTRSAFSKPFLTFSVKSWTLLPVTLNWSIQCCVPDNSKNCELFIYKVNLSIGEKWKFSEMVLFLPSLILTLHLV